MAAPVDLITTVAPAHARRRTAPALGLLLWLAGLVAGLALLHRIGGAVLAGPPVSPGGWAAWWAGGGSVVAVMALLRLLVLGLGWYLLAVTVLSLVGQLVRVASLWRLLEVVTVRSVREPVAALVGLALVSVTTSPVSAAPSLEVDEVHAPVPVRLVATTSEDDVGDERSRDVGGLEVTDDRARAWLTRDLTRGDAVAPAGDEPGSERLSELRQRGGRFTGEDGPADPAGSELDEPAPVRDDEEHLVVAGESFWSIARVRLDDAGLPTDDASVVGYWRALIDANLDRLVVEDEPDLILPGQRLRIPPIAATSAAEGAP